MSLPAIQEEAPNFGSRAALNPLWGVLCSLKCVSVLEGGSTLAVRPRELTDEETSFVPTYRPGVRSHPLECYVIVDWPALVFESTKFQMPGASS